MAIDEKFFGAGFAWPLQSSNGRLVLTSGLERLWQSIEFILQTPVGTCALDPNFGVELVAFDPITDPALTAWKIGQAIERSEPRIKDITIRVQSFDADTATLWIEIEIVPIGVDSSENRVFPFYQVA